MTKKESIFICEVCGNESAKWTGKCLHCGAWNSLKEVQLTQSSVDLKKYQKPTLLSNIKTPTTQQIKTNISEFDLVLGGGIIPGSITLIGGEPGIGKSTLLLQIAEKIKKSLYISAEESLHQIKTRVQRLGITPRSFYLNENNLQAIIAAIENENPVLVVIDSIQTIYDSKITSSAGSPIQVKNGGLILQKLSKDKNIPIILVGHITKEGIVAGPKTLEHLVDTVLYLEGEKYQDFRILRATKNRFGPVGETGIFQMTNRGLAEVTGASKFFVENRKKKNIGSCLSVIIEGSRAFLVEVQALSIKTIFGFPQRKVSGFDINRFLLLLAVLSERVGTKTNDKDFYLNITGGQKVYDPALDLAVCVAIYSAIYNKAVKDWVVLGEVGMLGEIRNISQAEKRLSEAWGLGIEGALIPKNLNKNLTNIKKRFKINYVEDIRESLSKMIIR